MTAARQEVLHTQQASAADRDTHTREVSVCLCARTCVFVCACACVCVFTCRRTTRYYLPPTAAFTKIVGVARVCVCGYVRGCACLRL